MVQEFKEYDKKYSVFKGKLMGYEERMARSDSFNLKWSIIIKSWAYPVGKYSNAEIRDAVYFADGAEQWQQFRVSQKGFNTQEKLYRLYKRHYHYCEGKVTYPNQEVLSRLEKIRIDNYIGALVRGGQLNTRLEIVK